VRLEPFTDGDLPLLEQLLGDPAMTEHLGGPESPEKLAERLERYVRPGSGMYKIVDDETGEALGSVGFWEREWRGEQVFETGWSVLPAFQGRGIAAGGDGGGGGAGGGRRTPPLHARLPVGGQRAVERDLPQARLRAARARRVRVPEGALDDLQRLATGPGVSR
jgi:hypothetical protein